MVVDAPRPGEKTELYLDSADCSRRGFIGLFLRGNKLGEVDFG